MPGYLLDETVHELKLDENESGVLKLKNTPENPLIISKVDAVTGEPIPDTVFEVRHSDAAWWVSSLLGRTVWLWSPERM